MKRTLTLLLMSMLVHLAIAGTVSERQALAIAKAFALRHGMAMAAEAPRMAAKRMLPAQGTAKAVPSYYVFNMDKANSGFVIVSGDDRMEPVLGYCPTGSFDSADIPDGLRWLLNAYTGRLAALQEGETVTGTVVSTEAVAPLVKAKWNQNAPYNLLTPKVDGTPTYTGCVATAIAQVLHHLKTKGAKAIPAYTTSTKCIDMPELPATTFDWDMMKTTYETTETDESAMEVAKLMAYCGQAVNMNYNTTASGSYVRPHELALYLGVSPAAKFADHGDYNKHQWDSLLFSELKAGRPVLYAGTDRSNANAPSAHQFVCDGYDGKGYFHINWGWGGMSDGYFQLSILSPPVQGIGGGTRGYVSDQQIVYNLKAAGDSETASPAATVYGAISIGDRITYRNDASQTFLTYVEVNFLNYGHRPHTYKFALQLYQGETFVKQLDFSDREYPTNSHEYWKCTFNNLDFTGVPDGTYRIVPASKAEGYAVTVPCENSDANYVEATLKDNTLTLTRHPMTAGGDFAVSGVTIDGKLVAGRKVPIRFTATNNGTGGSELPLSVELGFSNTETTVYVDPGQSEEVTVWITPSMPINDYYEQELMIVNSNDGTDLYYDTVTLTDPVTSSLSAGNITVSNSNGSSVSGTTLDFTVELKNRMSKAYDDYVIAVLYGVNNGTYVSQQTLYKPVTVAGSGTETVGFTFSGLDPGFDHYHLVLHYYNHIGTAQMLARDYEMGINQSYASLRGGRHIMETVDEMPRTLTTTVTNQGDTDYDNAVVFSLVKDLGNGYGREVSGEKRGVNIPAGGSAELTFNIPEDINEEGSYIGYCYYYSNGEKLPMSIFYFTFATGIMDITAGTGATGSPAKVFTPGGRLVGTMSPGEMKARLPKGVYIVKGKKVIN